MNINDYGFSGEVFGTVARVTAVHKERYEIACEHGLTHARLKTKEYYVMFTDQPKKDCATRHFRRFML